MGDKRLYILVPLTVQVEQMGDVPYTKTIRMESGRLMAQCSHVGRRWENTMAEIANAMNDSTGFPYEEITTIVLSVRNSKELAKVTDELMEYAAGHADIAVEVFMDTNAMFYGTTEKVPTATIIGQVYSGDVDHIIGHLELY